MAGALALSSAVIGCRDVDVPLGPPVDELVARYEEPTVALTPEIAAEVQATALDDVPSYVAASSLGVTYDALVELDGQLDGDGGDGEAGDDPFAAPSEDDGTVTDEPVPPPARGNGVFRLEIDCPGFGRRLGEVGDGGGGRIEVTVTLDGSRIQPVVWGAVEACGFTTRILDEAVDVLLDGRIELYLGPEGLRLTGGARLPDLLLDIAIARFEIGGVGGRPGLDFRLKRTGALEFRVDLSSSEHVFFVVDDGGAVVGIRDSVTEWFCNFDANVCTSGDDEVRF